MDIYYILFISISWQNLGLFPLLVIMNNAAIQIYFSVDF
jgi:hypothetical protein